MENFMGRGADIIALCTLLDKKVRRVIELDMQYVGCECPDELVISCGIDYAERYRNLPHVAH